MEAGVVTHTSERRMTTSGRTLRSSVLALAAIAAGSLVGLPRAEAAAPPANEKIELRYYQPTAERLRPTRDFVRPTPFDELTPGGIPTFDEPMDLGLKMLEPGPETLDLTLRWYR